MDSDRAGRVSSRKSGGGTCSVAVVATMAIALVLAAVTSPGRAMEPTAGEVFDTGKGSGLTPAAELRQQATAQMAGSSLQPLDEREMAGVSARSLLMADAFHSDDFLPEGEQDLSFRRMTLNADLEMNLNIDRLQLGCGGVNALLDGAGETCDIDIDFLSFMGTGPGQPGAVAAGEPVESDFLLEFPYLELALANEDDPLNREVVGLKVGARGAQGWLSMGRFLEDEVIDGVPCSDDPDRIQCHRGINRMSGWMETTLEGQVFGCMDLPGGSNCPVTGEEEGGPDPGDPTEQLRVATFSDQRELYGTRMTRVFLDEVIALPENVPGDLDLPPLETNINQALRFIHGLELAADENSVADFFLSFQREPVIWPNFDQNIQPGPDGNFRAANTGWWMSLPDARLEGLETYNKVIDLDFIAAPGFDDVDIGQRPAANCYGGLTFC